MHYNQLTSGEKHDMWTEELVPVEHQVARGQRAAVSLGETRPYNQITISDDHSEGSAIKRRKLMAVASTNTDSNDPQNLGHESRAPVSERTPHKKEPPNASVCGL